MSLGNCVDIQFTLGSIKNVWDVLPDILTAVVSMINFLFVLVVFFYDRKTREKQNKREINEFWFRKTAVEPVLNMIRFIDKTIKEAYENVALNINDERQAKEVLREILSSTRSFRNSTRAGLDSTDTILQKEVQDKLIAFEDKVSREITEGFTNQKNKNEVLSKIIESFQGTNTDILVLLKKYEMNLLEK